MSRPFGDKARNKQSVSHLKKIEKTMGVDLLHVHRVLYFRLD